MADYDFAVARLATTKMVPYLTQHVMSLIPVEKPGLGTMAVDKWGRCYYDPELFNKWTMLQSAGVVLHEDMHIFLQHHKRAVAHLGENHGENESFLWNIAGDISINDMLKSCGVALPDGCVYSDSFGFEKNLTTEEYYNLLLEMQKKQKQKVQAAGGGSHKSGSAADGQQKPWEDGPPNGQKGDGEGEGGAKTADGLDDFEQERLRRVVAQAMDRFESDPKNRGKLPGEFKRICDEILRPKVDPRREILAQVKYALNCTNGFGVTTWTKLNRRCPPGSMRLPAHKQPYPRVCVIVDTSGSMDQKDLGLALGVIAAVVKALPNAHDGLTVVTGDTQSANCQKVFGASAVELLGGGGTDMGAIIEDVAARKPRYDVIVVCSDGETPWGNRVDARVVACLSRKSEYYKVPDWIKPVYIQQV